MGVSGEGVLVVCCELYPDDLRLFVERVSDFLQSRTSLQASLSAISEMCWQQAQKKQVPDDKAAENAVGAFIIGGMVGVAVSQAANEDAYRGSLRDQCMAKKGYTKAKAT